MFIVRYVYTIVCVMGVVFRQCLEVTQTFITMFRIRVQGLWYRLWGETHNECERG